MLYNSMAIMLQSICSVILCAKRFLNLNEHKNTVSAMFLKLKICRNTTVGCEEY